jgi:hypothetical protein
MNLCRHGFDIACDEMVGDDIAQEPKPEAGELSQQRALLWNALDNVQILCCGA